MRTPGLVLSLIFVSASFARAGWVCDEHPEWCPGRGSSPKPGSQVSSGSSLRLNPSAVPVEKGLGLETIAYKGLFDFALVKGLGRVGAGISPSNGEETFFGPPGFELPDDFYERKLDRDKFRSRKITLATAFNLISNKKKGIKRVDINLGALAKYNPDTQVATSGAGVSAVMGPFTLGYANYRDQAPHGPAAADPRDLPRLNFTVETFSVGIFLTSFALDYSKLRETIDDLDDPPEVSTVTGTFFLPWGLLTVARRQENSSRLAYNYELKTLEEQRVKTEMFYGAQIYLGSSAMLGLFYNYYLLREGSLGFTLFF